MLHEASSVLIVAVVGMTSVVRAAGSTVQLVNDTGCDCFLTNGSEPTYYARHMFFDFRSLGRYAGVPDVIGNDTLASYSPPTSDFFAGDRWNDTWQIQGWSNRNGSHGEGKGGLTGDATVLMVNSPSNVYIEKNGDDGAGRSAATFMTLRTKRLPGFQTAAEFQAQDTHYRFLSLRMLARTVGDPGAVSAVFTYRAAQSLSDVQEADIEILTRGPRNKVQYTNQPSYQDDQTGGGDHHGDDGNGDDPKATRNATMPHGLRWSDWAVHRLDWTPRRSVWFVDGVEVASIDFQVPRDASGLNVNSWSDGGQWSGNMSVGGESKLQIQWLEMVFNTTEDGDGDGARRRRSASKRQGEHEQHHHHHHYPHSYSQQRRDAAAAAAAPEDNGGGGGGCKIVCSIDETSRTGTAAKLWDGSTSGAKPSSSAGSTLFWLCACAAASTMWLSAV
ncbi:xylanase 3 [Purpureocillium lavendulum]|uniref:Xylanase 3 n=1 Tax=Purpureocillium lavendulum TaxID=1247861 RepID=A0AB34G6H1_9HYPO|nr:xylanase 3 [Purpureocillium lavendulum]